MFSPDPAPDLKFKSITKLMIERLPAEPLQKLDFGSQHETKSVPAHNKENQNIKKDQDTAAHSNETTAVLPWNVQSLNSAIDRKSNFPTNDFEFPPWTKEYQQAVLDKHTLPNGKPQSNGSLQKEYKPIYNNNMHRIPKHKSDTNGATRLVKNNRNQVIQITLHPKGQTSEPKMDNTKIANDKPMGNAQKSNSSKNSPTMNNKNQRRKKSQKNADSKPENRSLNNFKVNNKPDELENGKSLLGTSQTHSNAKIKPGNNSESKEMDSKLVKNESSKDIPPIDQPNISNKPKNLEGNLNDNAGNKSNRDTNQPLGNDVSEKKAVVFDHQKISGISTPMKNNRNRFMTPLRGTPIAVPNNNHFAIHAVNSPYWKQKTNVYAKYSPNRFTSTSIAPTKSTLTGDPKDLILGVLKSMSDKIDFEKVDPPPLQVQLRPYQLEGLGWMKKKEVEFNGGILADEMGLGKTVSMIALMSAEKRKTLIIVPLPVLDQWEKEIKNKGPPMKIAKYQGPYRGRFGDFDDYDVVLTTYNLIALEFMDDKEDQESVLFNTNWGRVILDEAHLICNRNTKSAKACFSLISKSRWCLSGTLIQNKIDDLYSYFHFIDKKSYGDFASFKEDYIKVFERNREEGMMKFHVLFKALVLRRTKIGKNGEEVVKLPPINIETERLEFTERERDIYDRIVSHYQKKILKKHRQGMQVFGEALVLLCRTKQGCVNIDSVKHILEKDTDEPANFDVDGDLEDDIVSRMAGVTIQDEIPASTKFQRAIALVRQYREQKTKTIIFSQFTCALKSFKAMLQKFGIKSAFLEGSMSTAKRNEQIANFDRDDDCSVLLASLKCASTGMNLTMASNVILLDLWWNPAIQEQAYARVHRMGQTKPVNVHVLVIQQSVEDIILNIQERKKQLIKAAIGENTAEKLTSNEILRMFNIVLPPLAS